MSLLSLQVARQALSACSDSPTWDEGLHLACGYDILRTGDYRLDPEHPPLGRILCALPLLALQPDPKLDSEAWAHADFAAQGMLFLNQNRLSSGALLLPARLVTIALTALLALLVAYWTRTRFGAAASVVAVLLFTVDPNLSAHGHLATTDMIVALTSFATCLAFERFLTSGRARDLLLAGLVLGLALVSKFSALFLLPALALLYALHCWRAPRPPASVAWHALGLALPAALVVFVTYWPESVRALRGWADGSATRLHQVVPRDNAIGYGLRVAGRYLGVPAHRYFVGLSDLAERNRKGHESYLLGTVRQRGVWYYFPFAFLVKTSLGVLLLLGLALPLLGRARPPGLSVLLVPLAVYWALCLASGINIGYRHLLVSLPFLYALLAALWTHCGSLRYGSAAPALLGFALAAAALEPAVVTRDEFGLHDLAFFNLAAGGPAHGPRLLVDSNLDWGQDLGRLKSWLEARGALSQACLDYFGGADQYRYGFPGPAIPSSAAIARGERPACRYAAISATPLEGVYVGPERFAWLRRERPVARIGWSIYVYDLDRILPLRDRP